MTASTVRRSFNSFFLLVCLLSLFSGAVSEIRSFNGLIEAASGFVHYSEGYIVAPGFVDVSNLVFSTTDEADQDGQEGDEGSRSDSTQVDVVLFREPSSCSNSRNGCFWPELGVGASDSSGGLRWCCSQDAIGLGFCEENHYGRLIVNTTLFSGLHRFITVPATGDMETRVKYGKLDEPIESGKYILIVANCDDRGRDVYVSGNYTWKSAKGYLPGDLFPVMYFFIVLTFLYFILFGLYAYSMNKYEDSIIPIQKWILTTIGMGLLETLFKTGDLIVWNVDGTRFWFAMYTGVIIGVLKRGISRCLILVVSMGWGVISNDLGERMKKVIALGLIYVGTSTARDLLSLWYAWAENQTKSDKKEAELGDALTVLVYVVAIVDVVFFMWILDCLNGSMEQLENMNQQVKLKRYLRLRCILLFSILFAVMCFVFVVVSYFTEEAMIEESEQWAIQASWELNYLFVLVCVSILWKPNANAKDYAFVMELPSVGDDGEFEGTIPSANDDEDETKNAIEMSGLTKSESC